MKVYLFILVISILQIINCIGQGVEHDGNIQTNYDIDTLVSKKTVYNQTSNIIEYCVINENDTSDFKIAFSKNRENGEIIISAQYDLLYKKGKLYKYKLEEFEKILKKATKDIEIDSVSTLVLGRLITTGDLAITITNEFINKYGDGFEKSDYNYLPDFLFESKLAKDINHLFRPYHIQIADIQIEKLGFVPSKYITSSSLIETSENEIPEKIIDCLIWIELEKIKD